YLEYHRGTYTAMARNKRSNRKTELLLREVELWREYARRKAGLAYPNDALRSIWRRMLTLQFHDILPGSSIKKVYDDSKETYAQLEAELTALREEAFAALGERAGGDVLLYNSLTHERADIVWLDAPQGVTALRDAKGTLYPVQHTKDGACAYVRGLAPMGATPMDYVFGAAADGAMDVDTKYFVTPYFEGEFDQAMRIVSLIDRRCGRQLVKEGQALNRIVCYENRPHNYDAWDINIYYDERSWEVDELVSAQVVESGPVLTKIRCEYRFNQSTIVQHIVFYRDIDRIDFETFVDWKEQHYLLKAHFPADILYNEATYDIQFGNVKRATHKNTTWDAARFEVCAHKWMDVSEAGYGLSLLNDCKYGHSADENSIALTLLKSSTAPNPLADQEEHVFTYSIMPHEGDWRGANTPQMAYRLNVPVTAAAGRRTGGALAPFVRVDRENVMIESVKRALREEATVVRLYETFGKRTKARLTLGFEAAQVLKASMMEDRQEEITAQDGVVELELRPYEIVTLIAQ
ncbi:MAG: alpha-mannosidase, partial [Clostridia bacterium]|nr:alpha-mannosidase [Clostridia bacterium]